MPRSSAPSRTPPGARGKDDCIGPAKGRDEVPLEVAEAGLGPAVAYCAELVFGADDAEGFVPGVDETGKKTATNPPVGPDDGNSHASVYCYCGTVSMCRADTFASTPRIVPQRRSRATTQERPSLPRIFPIRRGRPLSITQPGYEPVTYCWSRAVSASAVFTICFTPSPMDTMPINSSSSSVTTGR